MKNKILVLCVLTFASSFAGAAALAAKERISGRKNFSRPLARPAAARAASGRPSPRKGFAAASTTKGTSAFSKTKRLTGAAGDTTAAPAPLTYGESRPPVYSNAEPARTQSVDGGGFVAIDRSRAVDAASSPGVTLGPPDKAQSSGAGGGGGSGGSSNGPAFTPSF